MQKSNRLTIILAILLLAWPTGSSLAGNLEPVQQPTAGSDLPNMTGIYNQLDTGNIPGIFPSFMEPGTSPTPSGRSLSEIQGKLPIADNIYGLQVSDTPEGKTFWSLRNDATWGHQTGTAIFDTFLPVTPRDFDTNRYILFAHGMGDNPNSWNLFAAEAARRGYTVLRVQVQPCGSIQERAEKLAKYINANIPDGVKAVAVGHSMGGLDLRYIVGQAHAGNNSPVPYLSAARKLQKVVTIATPHGGSFGSGLPTGGVLPCEGQPARDDLSDAKMSTFNSNYPPAEFTVDSIPMPFLAFHFQCWACIGSNDCVVGATSQTWQGAPAYHTTLSGKHSNDLYGPIGAGCTAEQDNSSEVLIPLLNDLDYGYVAPVANRIVRIDSRRSGKCIDIAAVSQVPGANAQQWTCMGDSVNQVFKLNETAPGQFQLRVAHSGQCLTVQSNNVVQDNCQATSAFTWTISNATDSGFYTIRNNQSGKCLDLAGGSLADGANIQEYNCVVGEFNQEWRLLEPRDRPRQLFSIKSGKVLEVANNSTSDGTNIQVWSNDGYVNKWFYLVRLTDGAYRIIANNSGKCLDVTGAGIADGVNVQLFTCDDVDNQKFRIETGSNGFVRIIARHSGKCLDLAGGATNDGVNIQQYQCVNSADISVDNQLWEIRGW